MSNQRNTTGRRPRITGIDAARAIAIIGMAYAHLGPIFFSSDIDTVASLLTTGFASALFAVLAGVSVSIMSQRGVEKGGVELVQSRQQLMLRGTILIGIGLVLSIAQYNIAVVLSAVGALFLVLPLVARWSNRALWALLGGLLALGPFVIVASDTFNTYVDIISGSYPLTAWFTYGVAGMLVHRYLIHSRMLQWISLVAGVVLAVIGVNARSWISDQLPAPEDPKMYDQLTTDPTPAAGVAGGGPGGATNSNPDIQSTWWYTYLGPEPHMGGLIDVHRRLRRGHRALPADHRSSLRAHSPLSPPRHGIHVTDCLCCTRTHRRHDPDKRQQQPRLVQQRRTRNTPPGTWGDHRCRHSVRHDLETILPARTP